MLTLVPDAIEKYAADCTEPESDALRRLVRETYAKTRIPQMQVGHLEGAFLRLLVRLTKAKRVLEIGAFTGYSALVMAEGMPSGGQVVTLDVDPEATDIARRHWARSPHGKKIELRLGPALETLKALKGPFDMVFIDADKTNYGNYWEAVLPKVRKGGLIIADNVLWCGRVLKPEDESDRAIVAFSKRVLSDKRVEAVTLTVRDGMLLAYKR